MAKKLSIAAAVFNLALLAFVLSAHAAPRPAPAAHLEILPAAVQLSGPQAVQSLLVTLVLPDGTRRDVTDAANFATLTPKTVAVSADGELTPKGDGVGAVTATWGKLTARVPVACGKTRVAFAPSFVSDVVPTLGRIGCSSGACHGAASGKGGFKLSLRGYAPELDYLSITRQMGGRRISRENPEHSLFLRKPLLEVAHRGGKKLTRGTRDYNLLLTWLKNGTPGPTGKEPNLTKLTILPGDRTLKPGEKQKLLVRAVYDDGHSEDVTRRAVFSSNDVGVTTVDEAGRVTQQRPGETAVLARYRDRLAVTRFLAPFGQKVDVRAFDPPGNAIDDAVNAKLRQLHITPSGQCTDAEFVRRAFIDAIGTLPTGDEARAFLDSKDPVKREKLVDALLQRPEFGMVWALKFGDLFVLRREAMQRKNAMQLQQWLTDQFNADRPWNQIATELLTATGDPDTNRAAFFFVSRTPQKGGEKYWIRQPEATAELTAQVFLGSRIACAKCHNHPSEKYTQDDYYHYVALWQQVTGKGTREGSIPETIDATGNGDVRQPRTAQLMTPRPLDRLNLGFAKAEDRRGRTAAWMVHQPDFARNLVNRAWARCFGVGIVNPVDDIRSTNPPNNPLLMDALCREFVAHGDRLKPLLAAIMKSKTYGRSASSVPGNVFDMTLCSHYPARRLPAEELLDAVAQVTGVPDRFSGMAVGTRACELADSEIPSALLDTLGRPVRIQPTEGERSCSPAISQALVFLNSEAVQQKLKSGDGVLTGLLQSKLSDARILDTLFLSALSRHPSPAEAKTLLAAVQKSPKRDEGWQDVLWALLNSKEFLFNH